MSEVLNQNEVDALLSAIAGGDVQAAEGASPDRRSARHGDSTIFSSKRHRPGEDIEVANYDFKRPERVSKDQMRALESLHEAFARNFGAQLSGFLRTIVEVRVVSTEQLTYGQFIQALPNPTSFNLLGCHPLDGRMCLEISPLIIYPIIDRLLGGSNAELFIPQRPLTQIEQRLVGKITDRAMLALTEAWGATMQIMLQFKLHETESNPQLVQIVPPNEVVVVIGFELKMGAKTGTMSLCIPFNVIEPVVDKLASQSWSAYARGRGDARIRRKLTDGLNRAPLLATGILAETTITMRDLSEMAPGDIIVTPRPAAQPVVFSIEGRKKFLAHIGQYRGQRALRIVRQVTPKDRV